MRDERDDKEKKVVEIVTAFAELVGRDISPIALDMYVSVLSDYPLDKIQQAASNLLKSQKWSKLPMPAEFIELIDPPEQVDVKANAAWRLVLDTIEQHGYVRTVRFEDAAITQTILAMGGWIEFCNRTRFDSGEDLHWLQKEFERRYRSYSQLPFLRNEILIGWCDAQNGEKAPEICRIGTAIESAIGIEYHGKKE